MPLREVFRVSGSISTASLRIEMVLPSLALAGMETMTRDLAAGLAMRGHRVGVTCLEEEGELAEDLRGRGVGVSLVKTPGVRPNFLADSGLKTHFASIGCDIVHMHNVWSKAALACRSAKVPAVVATLHGFAHGERWFDEPLRWWGARHCDAVVAVSDSLRRHLLDRTGVRADKVVLLGNGIDTDRFAPGPRSGAVRSRFGIPEDVPVIGCVARFDPVKNHALLLRALRQVLTSFPRTRLALLGEGPLRGELEAQATEMGLAEAVIFLGSCRDTAPFYRDLDMFVLPSLSEGTSISLLEALASGLPAVATAVGGTPDILADGPCGLLVPSGNEVAMAAAMASVLRDQELRIRLGAAARSRAVSCFSLVPMVEGYEKLYRSAFMKKNMNFSQSPRSS
jgi:glycosyltransferase involved in cell wall biosynthesis